MAGALASVAMLASGCAAPVAGTPTWPGAFLQRALLGSGDFPPGVQYDRINEEPGMPDGSDGPGSMLSRPKGCANSLTNVIRQGAERGPGSAAKYAVSYDGVRVGMTVLSWNLDLDKLRAEADRCAEFEAFFDASSDGIPMSTIALPGLDDGAVGYQQTMNLRGSRSSVYMAFQNVGDRAVFGAAFPAGDPTIDVKASLPQTFLEIFTKQAAKLQAS